MFFWDMLGHIKLQFVTCGRVPKTQRSFVSSYPTIPLKRLRKTTVDLSQDARYRWRESKTEPASSWGAPLTHPKTFL